MRKKGFVDIHCHSVMTHYRNKESGTPACEEINRDVLPLIDKIMGKEGLRSYNTQSDFGKLANNNVKAIIISLYPIERKWFIPKFPDGSNKFKLISNITGFSLNNVKKMAKEKPIDYFADLEGEYKYLLDQLKKECGDKKFEIVNNYGQLGENLKKEDTVSIVISIEGASSLASGLPEKYLEKKPSKVSLNDYNRFYRDNVYKMKSWGPDNDGSHAPFFIGLSHHFWNILAGHCESLPWMLNQRKGKETGITKAGWQMIKDLLSTKDIHGNPDKTKRVQIDVKHMSPLAREQYYDYLKKENINAPIIFSHAAIGDAPNLEVFIRGTRAKRKFDKPKNYFNTSSLSCNDEDIREVVKSNGIIGIVLHEGRIAHKRAMDYRGYNLKKKKRMVERWEKEIGGLQLRLRQAGSDIEKKRILKMIDARLQKKLTTIEAIKDAYMCMIMANIFKVVQVTHEMDNTLKGKGWEHVCIGSDYDGMINKLDFLGTVNEFGELRERFVGFLKNPEALKGFDPSWTSQKLKGLQFGIAPEKLANMFFEDNSMAFLKTWF